MQPYLLYLFPQFIIVSSNKCVVCDAKLNFTVRSQKQSWLDSFCFANSRSLVRCLINFIPIENIRDYGDN